MKQDKEKNKYVNSLWTILIPLVIFCGLGLFFAFERAGVSIHLKEESAKHAFLTKEQIIPKADRTPDKRCLVITNTSNLYDSYCLQNTLTVLKHMNVGYNLLDTGKNIESTEYGDFHMPITELPPLDEYKTMIITLESMEPIHSVLDEIMNWVKAGGGLLFAISSNDYILTNVYYEELGIEMGTYDYIPHINAILETDFLAGGRDLLIRWSENESIDELREGINYKLSKSSIVHMTSTGPKGPSPMLWENRCGSGKIVVNNNDAFAEKWSRGLIAAAYSLLEPVVAWPVINASVFFIDDFPAPIPEGYNDYIKKEFGVQNEYFFVHIWFPSMLSIADKYKIKYSSVFIESYNDDVIPPFSQTENTDRMSYFGALFLNEGHEIGFHGYNHQSLVFENFDYKDELPYNKWHSEADMSEALRQAVKLQNQLFPNNVMHTYVPPSNVLSSEARVVLANSVPDINVISGLFVDGIFNLEDDFETAGDGIINIPRVASGYFPMEEYDEEHQIWMILNVINLYFINSHFIHPDDVMDPDRGAELGWKYLSKSFEGFLAWLERYSLRNMTAQEAAPAIQRYENITAHTTLGRNQIVIDLDGFIDEAFLLVRINDGVPRETHGGTLSHLSEGLYLLKADEASIRISLASSSPSRDNDRSNRLATGNKAP